MSQSRPVGYRGPDRRSLEQVVRTPYRGPDRRTRSAPGHRPWRLVTIVMAAILVGIVVRADARGLGAALTYESLRDTGDCLLLLAGAALVVTWSMDGRACHAFDGVALGLVGGGQLVLGGPIGTLVQHVTLVELLSPAACLALAVPALLLLARSPAESTVDSGIRPGWLFLRYASVAASILAVLGAVSAVHSIDDQTVWAVVLLGLALAWTAAGSQRLRVAVQDERTLHDPLHWLGWGMVGVGLGDVVLAVTLLMSIPRLAGVAAGLQVMAGAAAAVAAGSWLVAVLRRYGNRTLRTAGELWETRDELADAQHSRGQLLHDARNMLASIRIANSTLERYQDRLDVATSEELRVAMRGEFARLESLLDRPEPAPEYISLVEEERAPGRRPNPLPALSRTGHPSTPFSVRDAG